MKKMLLASAVAALSVGTAQAAPQVYGKAFLAVEMAKTDTTVSATGSNAVKTTNTTRPQLNSVGSRIGFKGSEALSPNTDAIYKLEYGVNLDDNRPQFASRETYIGLQNKQYGTLKVGRIDGIDGEVDFANVLPLASSQIGGANVLSSRDGDRANNSITYVSPQYNATTLMAMYVMDENAADNVSDAFGVAAKFEPADAPYRAGASYVQSARQKHMRVSGAYDLAAGATVGALYQVSDSGVRGSVQENALSVSGEYKYGQTPWTTYAQVDLLNNAGYVRNSGVQRLVVGGKYAFSPRTTGHVYGGYQKGKLAVSEAGVTVQTNADALGVGAGIEHKF